MRRLLTILCVAVCLTAAGATAEVRRLEVVGAVPVDPDGDGAEAQRRAALEAALDEAVSRVARGLLAGPEGEAPELELGSKADRRLG